MGEVEFIFWVRFGGVYDGSSNYVGGDTELLLAKKNIDFDGFKKIISEFLNVGDGRSKMHFKFFTGHPVKPLYEVTDNRTLRLFMYYARQDPVNNSLMVTVEDEVSPSTEGIKNPPEQTKESPTSTKGYLERLESISEGTKRDVFERDFDIAIPEDSSYVAATAQESSPYVAANPHEDSPYVTRTPLQSSPYVAASLLVEPYTNVPPIPHNVSHTDDNAAGSGDEKSCSEGVYGASSISDEIEEYKIFKSKKDLTTSLSIISMREKFQFKTFKSNSHFTIVRCLDTSCSWRVRAKRLEGSGYWMVTKYEKKHTCATDFKKVRYRQATSWVVGECMKKRLINPGRVFKPRDVIDDMKRKFSVDISYSVAWRGREYAYENLRLGTPEQSYSLLPEYLYMLRETNPGTVVHLEVGDEDRFKYLFIAFDASIKGFQYCRPVVSIDATHMKGKYRGVLFMAVCHDANQQIFPLAFGIGDSENDAAWTWFLRRIKDVFGERPGLVIVSDRHRSINNAVKEVFPNAFHGICMYHLLNNLKNKFKTKTKELEQHYIQTAKAYNLQEFHVLFYTLCCAVPGAKEYLEGVGLDKWTRSHSPSRRYNIMTTNISESMNAALVKVRELPITAFVNEIRLLCQRWFFERRNKAKDFISKMSKDVEKKLEKRRDRAQLMDIRYADEYKFDVVDGDQNFCVDMAVWTCSCGKFQLDQLPCEHVLVVVRKSAYEAYDLCSPFYSREYWYESYSGVINPLPHITSWCIPEDVSSVKIMPPDVRTSVGRRRKRRIPSVGEEQSQPKCSRCRESGHNRATCQNPIALHPSGQTFTPYSTNPSFQGASSSYHLSSSIDDSHR